MIWMDDQAKCILSEFVNDTNLRQRKLCILAKKAQQELINVYKYREGARLFPVVPHNRTRGDLHKLKLKRLPLNIRKHFFTVTGTKNYHRLTRETVEIPPLVNSSC